ncbi:MAG: type 1 glutamine amidotransferase [Candidatus Omnitrophica bacterium]|nr:type 1 glutamine amidotransferase [Candidatus Omnitrophota bacterium]
MIIVIKHIDIEGPETLGVYLRDKGFDLQTIAMESNDPFPDTLEKVDAVICLGGPMNVYEEQKYPFLEQEDLFIKRILDCQVPFLGICLGSQLLAKASGGTVVKSPMREIGFADIHITANGIQDALFSGVGETMRVYQWHEDMSELPPHATLLATSPECPQQAWKIGPNAYGIQFHIEITEESIYTWTERYFHDAQQRETQQQIMLDEYTRIKPTFDRTAQIVYDNFLMLIKAGDRG